MAWMERHGCTNFQVGFLLYAVDVYLVALVTSDWWEVEMFTLF